MKKQNNYTPVHFNPYFENWSKSNVNVLQSILEEARINEQYTAGVGRRLTDQSYNLLAAFAVVLIASISYFISQMLHRTIGSFELVLLTGFILIVIYIIVLITQLIKTYVIFYPGSEPHRFNKPEFYGITQDYIDCALQNYYFALIIDKQRNIDHNSHVNLLRAKKFDFLINIIKATVIFFSTALCAGLIIT